MTPDLVTGRDCLAVFPLCVKGKTGSEEENGLSVRSGAGQAHPKGHGPVSSKLDTGSLTGRDSQDQLKNGRESTSVLAPLEMVAEGKMYLP